MEAYELIARADHAKALLDNPVWLEVTQALRNSLDMQRRHVKLTDVDGHTKLIMAEQVMHQVTEYLHHAIEDGKTAQMRLVQPTLRERVFQR